MNISLDSIIRTAAGTFTVVDIDERHGELIYDIKSDDSPTLQWCYATDVLEVIKY